MSQAHIDALKQAIADAQVAETSLQQIGASAASFSASLQQAANDASAASAILAQVIADSQAAVAGLEAELPPPPIPPPSTGLVRNVAELKQACKVGGSYDLAPGTYTGNFVIEAPVQLVGVKGLTGQVPAGATASVTIEPEFQGDATIKVLPKGISGIRLQGLTVISGNKDRATILIGSDSEADPLMQPDNVVIDQCEVVAKPAGCWRGVDCHTRAMTLIRSRVTGYWYNGRDAQAFYACNGPGPYTVEDCYLEGSGENVLFGGGTHKSAAMIPTNIVVRGNYIVKPPAWRTNGADVKNLVEIKAGIGALIENNVLDGCWKDAQDGHCILLTPRNQYNNSPWVQVRDVIVRGNRTLNIDPTSPGYFIQTLSQDVDPTTKQPISLPTMNITVEGNLHTGRAFWQCNGGIDGDLIIRRNTFPLLLHAVLTFNNTAINLKPKLAFDSNVGRHGYYGINSQSAGVGYPALDYYCTAWSMDKNNQIEESNGTTFRWGKWPASVGKLYKLGELAQFLDPQSYKFLPGGAGW